MRRQAGFTLVEITIVIVIIGILTATLAPLLLRQHTNTMEERDRVALEEAKTAIISYATTFGGIPDPVGIVSNVMPTVPAFGVNNWGAFGDNATNPFRLDVNNALSSNGVTTIATGVPANTGGDRVVFCQAVNAQMQLAAPQPLVCQDYNNRTATACAASSPVAFVLYSTGNNRIADQENNEASLIGTNNRIYENDKRGINNSPGNDHYDDQVMSYPVSALARDCREKMGVAVEVMACPAGQKYVGSVTNSDPVNSIAYTLGVTLSAPVPANGFTSYVNTCHLRADTVTVGTQGPTALSTLDANNDGRVDIVITGINSFTAQ